MSENDFHRLKADQTLLVDFAVFPKSLVLLLRQCLQCCKQEHPKFVAVLMYGGGAGSGSGGASNSAQGNQHQHQCAVLSVQETNQFRHLQHISLRLVAANSERLREYLGRSLMRFKGESAQLQEALGEAKQSLHRAKHDKKTAEQYAQSVKHKYEQCLCDLKTSHSAQLSDLKAAHLEQAQEARKQLVAARDAVEKELKLQLKALEVKHAGQQVPVITLLLFRTSFLRSWILSK